MQLPNDLHPNQRYIFSASPYPFHWTSVVIAWCTSIKHSPDPISNRSPAVNTRAAAVDNFNHLPLPTSELWGSHLSFKTSLSTYVWFDNENMECFGLGCSFGASFPVERKAGTWSWGFGRFDHEQDCRIWHRQSGTRDKTYSLFHLSDQVFSCSSLVKGSGYWFRSSLITFWEGISNRWHWTPWITYCQSIRIDTIFNEWDAVGQLLSIEVCVLWERSVRLFTLTRWKSD